MKKIIWYILTFAIFAFIYIVQINIIGENTLFGVRPNAILMSCIVVSLWQGLYVGSIYSLVNGIVCDLIYGNTFGIYTLSFTIISVVIGYFNKSYRKESEGSAVWLGIIATVMYEVIMYIQCLVVAHTSFNVFIILKNVIIACILNATLIYVINKVFSKIVKRLLSKITEY